MWGEVSQAGHEKYYFSGRDNTELKRFTFVILFRGKRSGLTCKYREYLNSLHINKDIQLGQETFILQ